MVVDRYKQEMSDVEYIDSSIIAATADVIRKLESEKGRISCTRMDRIGKDSKWENSSLGTTTRKSMTGERKLSVSGKSEMEEESNTRDKQTQTPRNIPYDDLDPVLTDTAYIGRFERGTRSDLCDLIFQTAFSFAPRDSRDSRFLACTQVSGPMNF